MELKLKIYSVSSTDFLENKTENLSKEEPIILYSSLCETLVTPRF